MLFVLSALIIVHSVLWECSSQQFTSVGVFGLTEATGQNTCSLVFLGRHVAEDNPLLLDIVLYVDFNTLVLEGRRSGSFDIVLGYIYVIACEFGCRNESELSLKHSGQNITQQDMSKETLATQQVDQICITWHRIVCTQFLSTHLSTAS